MTYEVVDKYCKAGEIFDKIEDARFFANKDARIICRDDLGRTLMTFRWTARMGWCREYRS